MVVVRVTSSHTNKTKVVNLRGYLANLRNANLEGFAGKNLIMNDLEPTEFYLSQNYPNPFYERTTIKFCLAYKTKVKLVVFDSEGNMIKELLNELKDAGTYEVEFQSAAHSPHSENEINFYQLEAGDYLSRRKMIIQH